MDAGRGSGVAFDGDESTVIVGRLDEVQGHLTLGLVSEVRGELVDVCFDARVVDGLEVDAGGAVDGFYDRINRERLSRTCQSKPRSRQLVFELTCILPCRTTA